MATELAKPLEAARSFTQTAEGPVNLGMSGLVVLSAIRAITATPRTIREPASTGALDRSHQTWQHYRSQDIPAPTQEDFERAKHPQEGLSPQTHYRQGLPPIGTKTWPHFG